MPVVVCVYAYSQEESTEERVRESMVRRLRQCPGVRDFHRRFGQPVQLVTLRSSLPPVDELLRSAPAPTRKRRPLFFEPGAEALLAFTMVQALELSSRDGT